jgi:hypothetical protein
MTSLLRLALLSLLPLLAGCDNVGRAFDPSVEPPAPPPGSTVQTIQVVPVGGDARDGRPVVRATYPSGSGWPTTVPVVVEFSESINESSIVPTTPGGADGKLILRVRGATAVVPCAYDLLADGRLLVLRPLTGLTNDQNPTYQVVLLPEARDCDGVRFDVPAGGSVLAEFQVNQDAALVDGRILAVYPRDNFRDAPRETAVFVVFDRPATPATVVAANCFVRPQGGATVAGTLELPLPGLGVPGQRDGRVARIAPNAALAGPIDHELVVTDAIAFGAEGQLDFNNRTPFARFRTVGPAPATAVALDNPSPGFPDKINLANVATARVRVELPNDAQVGDTVAVRVYGSDRQTTVAGDLTFVERTAQVASTTPTPITVAVDFSGVLGSALAPRFEDGDLTFTAQVRRGAQRSGIVQNDPDNAPRFDTKRPTVQVAGPPGSADGADLFTDLDSLVFHGRADERLGAATLSDGVNSNVELFASAADGTFVMRPLALGRLTAPRPFTLAVTDAAGNSAAAPFTGRIVPRGIVTGTLAGTLTVEAFDDATLAPIAGATVLVDPGTPTVPAAGQVTANTGADGRATFTGLTAPSHTITVVRDGYDLTTLYDSRAAFASLPLRSRTAATATWKGTVAFTPAPGATALLGNTAVADRGAVGVQTAVASATTIPDTAITPNRVQLVTGFAGVFEPTAAPFYASFGAPALGATLTTPTKPAGPVAPGATSQQQVVLAPAVGPNGTLPAPYLVNFAATGLDFAALATGFPKARITASLSGFEGQALFGVGRATSVFFTPSYLVDANFALPFVLGFASFAPLYWATVEARDAAGRVCRTRSLLQVGPPTTLTPGLGPLPTPAIDAPAGPSSAPTVTFVDVCDGATFVGNLAATHELTATDAAGRSWRVLVPDRDVAGALRTVQFPSLAALPPANSAVLSAGDWTVRVESRLWLTPGLLPATVDDCVLTERVRLEIDYVRSASRTFVVQ